MVVRRFSHCQVSRRRGILVGLFSPRARILLPASPNGETSGAIFLPGLFICLTSPTTGIWGGGDETLASVWRSSLLAITGRIGDSVYYTRLRGKGVGRGGWRGGGAVVWPSGDTGKLKQSVSGSDGKSVVCRGILMTAKLSSTDAFLGNNVDIYRSARNGLYSVQPWGT